MISISNKTARIIARHLPIVLGAVDTSGNNRLHNSVRLLGKEVRTIQKKEQK